MKIQVTVSFIIFLNSLSYESKRHLNFTVLHSISSVKKKKQDQTFQRNIWILAPRLPQNSWVPAQEGAGINYPLIMQAEAWDALSSNSKYSKRALQFPGNESNIEMFMLLWQTICQLWGSSWVSFTIRSVWQLLWAQRLLSQGGWGGVKSRRAESCSWGNRVNSYRGKKFIFIYIFKAVAAKPGPTLLFHVPLLWDATVTSQPPFFPKRAF